MPLREIRKPEWERQKGETDKGFSYFKIYRDLPIGAYDPLLEVNITPRPRSVQEAADIVGRSYSLLNKMCADWKWTLRCRAYDTYRDEVELNERKLRRIQAARKMEDRSIQYRDDAHRTYTKFLNTVHMMLDEGEVFETKEIQVPRVDTEGNETGEFDTVEVNVASGWNWNTVARITDALTRLATFGAGVDEAGVMDKLLERIDVANLTPEQRRRIINGENAIEVIFSAGGNIPASADVGA